MTATPERVAIWEDYDLNGLRETINRFITNEVSKVVDLEIRSLKENDLKTIFYAYLRYIHQ